MPIALQRLWVQLTADRKRFGALVASLLVALLLWARIIVVSNPPRRAVADDDSVARGQLDAGKATTSLERASDNPQTQTIRVALTSELRRDPFRINPKHFPRPITPVDGARDEGKSGLSEAERQERDEALRIDRIRSAAEQIALEAVMKGASLAVINGRTYRVGESVSSSRFPGMTFTLVEVGERFAIVECEQLRFELRLSN